MINIHDKLKETPSFGKLDGGGFLFAEYTCGVEDKKMPGWTETDLLIHVVTGKKTWHTNDGVWVGNPGETLFFKKGAMIVEQHFETEVCLLMLFIPDEITRGTVREVAGSLPVKASADAKHKPAIRVENDEPLTAFFNSMRAYLSERERPPGPLLRLKLKELIMSVLSSGRNPGLAEHFRSVGENNGPSVRETMEQNFRYNLSLEDYAKLCHRSLSSFKREFQEHFKESPGRWLLQKRLEYSAALLRNSQMNVTEVAFESGFEDVSHFSRVFKERFGDSPVSFREGAGKKV